MLLILSRNILFGIPQRLIMDNGANFIEKDIKEFCKKMKVDRYYIQFTIPKGMDKLKQQTK